MSDTVVAGDFSKPRVPKGHAKQKTFLLTLISLQDNPVLKVEAAHFCLANGLVMFFREPAEEVRAFVNRFAAYPAPIATFRAVDFLSCVEETCVAGSLEVAGVLHASMVSVISKPSEDDDEEEES